MQTKLLRVLIFINACICLDSLAFAQGRGNANRGLGAAAGNAAAAAGSGTAQAARATSEMVSGGSGKASSLAQPHIRQNTGIPRNVSQVPGVAAGAMRGRCKH